MFDPGDEVIIPAPYWVSYVPMALLAEAKPVIVPTQEANGFKLTAAELKASLTPRSKALVINSPSNPTGGVYTAEELAALGEVALARALCHFRRHLRQDHVRRGQVCEYGHAEPGA